jgi:hypothetical protein
MDMLRIIFAFIFTMSFYSVSLAKITAAHCSFTTLGSLYFTFYDDGTPTRVGTSVGIGDRAWHTVDKLSGSIVVIEMNTDNFPITMTTITPDMNAIHSRQIITTSGKIFSPTQGLGTCKWMPL